MSASSFPDLAVEVLVSGLRLFSMTPHPTPLSSPTMASSSRSEKLLRDALLRDERERQQLSSPSLPTRPPIHRRRHSHIPSSSSFSQGTELESDTELRRALFYGGDEQAINAPRAYQQQQQQQSTTSYRRSSPSPTTWSNRRGSTSTSPSPSPLRMKRRQESLSPSTHPTAKVNQPPNDINLRRNQSLQNTSRNNHGSAYPSPSHQGEVLPVRLERTSTGSAGSSIMMGRRDENEARDEQDWPWKRGRQGIRSGSESMISGSFNPVVTHSSSASHTNSSHFHPHTPQVQARTYNLPPNRSTQNVQNSLHYSPSSPHTPSYSTPGVGAGSPGTSFNRTRSQTEANSQTLIAHSPRRNNSSPTTATFLPSPSRSAKLTGSNLKPHSGNTAVGEVVKEQRLPTPPPSPPLITRVSLGNGTPTKTPVRSQSQRKKELRPLDFSSRQRQRDITITQPSHQALRSPTGPKKSNNNADGHSLASTESCSTGTSASSVSHLHVGCAGYSAYSSHSSLDGPLSAPLQPPPQFSDSHHLYQSQSIPPTPTTPFNARKASTQCRAIQGYVSFANVEGLGEPPLVIDEFDGDGFVEDGRGKGRKGSAPFLPLLSAAFGWKKFLGGGAAPGIGHGVEGQEQGLVV